MAHESDLLIAELAEQQREYHRLVEADSRPSELKVISDRIAIIKDGTSNSIIGPDCPTCPKCKRVPLGMLKTPAHMNRGTPVPPTYEIGCCGLNGRGWTPEIARENWTKRIE